MWNLSYIKSQIWNLACNVVPCGSEMHEMLSQLGKHILHTSKCKPCCNINNKGGNLDPYTNFTCLALQASTGQTAFYF